MQFSAMTEPHLGGTYDDLMTMAQWSESNGLASFARSDHYLWTGRTPREPATDAFATLAGLARDTTSIRLAVLVSPITFRHPAVIAKMAATIDEMSGGRLDLGVGTGWMEAEHTAFGLPFWEWSERFARLEEALGYMEAAFGPGHGRFEGQFYQLDEEVSPKPANVRLLVGGSGKSKTPRLAGRHADEYNLFVRPPADLKQRIDVMRQAAGSRPVSISVMGGALVGRTQAEYRSLLAKAASEDGKTPEEVEAMFAERGLPHGTPAQAAETIAALEEVGVEKYYLQWLEVSDLDGFAATVEALHSA